MNHDPYGIYHSFCFFKEWYKKGYFKGNEIDLTTDFKELDITLDPEAWLKIVTVPNNGESTIWFSGTFTGASGWDAHKNKGTQEFLFLTTGNRDKTVNWGNYQQAGAIGRDTIYLPAHDTTTYTIHY